MARAQAQRISTIRFRRPAGLSGTVQEWEKWNQGAETRFEGIVDLVGSGEAQCPSGSKGKN